MSHLGEKLSTVHWGDVEKLKLLLMYLASPDLYDPRGLRLTQNAYSSFLTHTKQLLLVTFCDTTAGIDKKN